MEATAWLKGAGSRCGRHWDRVARWAGAAASAGGHDGPDRAGFLGPNGAGKANLGK